MNKHLIPSGVIIALITAVASIITTRMTASDSDKDMKDSYKVLAEAVNELQRGQGRLEGRLDTMESRGDEGRHRKNHGSTGGTTGGLPAPGSSAGHAVLGMDPIQVEGVIDAGEGPAMSAAPALPPPPSLPASLEAALQRVREQ